MQAKYYFYYCTTFHFNLFKRIAKKELQKYSYKTTYYFYHVNSNFFIYFLLYCNITSCEKENLIAQEDSLVLLTNYYTKTQRRLKHRSNEFHYN